MITWHTNLPLSPRHVFLESAVRVPKGLLKKRPITYFYEDESDVV